MKKISINFFGEKVEVKEPSCIEELRKSISEKFLFSLEDVSELIMYYIKDVDKKLIQKEQDLIEFLHEKDEIKEINLDISQDSKIYKDSLKKIEKDELEYEKMKSEISDFKQQFKLNKEEKEKKLKFYQDEMEKKKQDYLLIKSELNKEDQEYKKEVKIKEERLKSLEKELKINQKNKDKEENKIEESFPLNVIGHINLNTSNGEYLNLYSSSQTIAIRPGESKVIGIRKFFNEKKYFKIEYETNVNLYCNFVYSDNKTSESKYEEFFLVPGEKTFKQFLDYLREPSRLNRGTKHPNKVNIGQAKNATYLHGIILENKQSKGGVFRIKSVDVKNRAIDLSNPQIFITTNKYKLGMSIKYGGALTFLEKVDEKVEYVKLRENGTELGYCGVNASSKPNTTKICDNVSIINDNDSGRLIQQSYYGTSVGYENIKYNNQTWCYNPVQGGDVGENRGQIIDFEVSSNEIYIKSRPMDWAYDGYTTPSYMENKYTIKDDNVFVYNSFFDWSGLNGEQGIKENEMPATYIHYGFGKIQGYLGNNPWKGEKLSSSKNLDFWGEGLSPGDPFYRPKNLSENWLAWTNDEDYGVGVYVPTISYFLNGYFQGSRGSVHKYCEPSIQNDYSSQGSTNYTAPLLVGKLTSYKKLSYSYALTFGNINTIRERFLAIKNNGVINNSNMHW